MFFAILCTTSLLASGVNVAFSLSSHCNLYFSPVPSMSNYSKSAALLIFKPFMKAASLKVLVQTHLKAFFILLLFCVCIESAVTGL